MCGPDGADLVRRWVAALLLVPEAEREGVVAAIERRVTEAYVTGASSTDSGDHRLHLVTPPTQREGYIEHVERSFVTAPVESKKRRPARERPA